MMNRTPQIFGRKIMIICEGAEEYDYMNRLKELKVFNAKYSIKIDKSKNLDNIIKSYQYAFSNNSNALVVVFCDTEIYPYEQFLRLVKKIDEFHNNKNAHKNVIYFANPCTMQIILSHFERVNLLKNSKASNSALIEKLTGVKNYDAKQHQRESIMKKINKDNYQIMKENMKMISSDYRKIPSSNVLTLFNNLENNDTSWLDSILKKI